VAIALATAIIGMIAAAVLGVLRAERTGAGLDAIRALSRGPQFGRALALLQDYLRSHPDDPGGRLPMGPLAPDPPDPPPDLAREPLAAVRARAPGPAALARVFEGKAQDQKGRYDLAESAWIEARRLDPIAPGAGWLLLTLLDQESRLSEAHALGMRLHAI